MEGHHPLGRRLKAARILAGYDDQLAFSELIPGVNSRGPIQKMESGQAPTPQQLAAWAKAAGVPIEWFFADFSVLTPREEPEGDPFEVLERLAQRIDEARRSQ